MLGFDSVTILRNQTGSDTVSDIFFQIKSLIKDRSFFHLLTLDELPICNNIYWFSRNFFLKPSFIKLWLTFIRPSRLSEFARFDNILITFYFYGFDSFFNRKIHFSHIIKSEVQSLNHTNLDFIFDSICLLCFNSNPIDSTFIELFFSEFLLRRSLYLSKSTYHLVNLYDGFLFREWLFYKSYPHCSFGKIHREVLEKHIKSLKLRVKSSKQHSLFSLIQSLNYLVKDWLYRAYFTDFVFESSDKLDLYLYRILWKLLKNRHAKKSKTWIFTKYWRYRHSRWFFLCQESLSGKVCILKTHCTIKVISHRLPLCLPTYNLTNHQKRMKFHFQQQRGRLH